MDGQTAADAFLGTLQVTEDQYGQIEAAVEEGLSAMELVDRFMSVVATGMLYEKIGEVTRPVRAYVFKSKMRPI
jgi:hypothetical protein